jgi:uncharacterized protein (DUF488 family)
MEIYTIGFTKRSAAQFFGTIQKAQINLLLDVRLNNVSQLAGFAKKDDLQYFLREICGAEYRHELLLAPTADMLSAFKKLKSSSWEEYERAFIGLMTSRKIDENISQDLFRKKTILLCSEYSPKMCHRRLVAEYLKSHWSDESIDIIHL